MARKVYVEVKVQLIIDMDEGVEVSEVINEMVHNFDSETENADIVDSEILGYEVTDSK
jgi:hypothetical protein